MNYAIDLASLTPAERRWFELRYLRPLEDPLDERGGPDARRVPTSPRAVAKRPMSRPTPPPATRRASPSTATSKRAVAPKLPTAKHVEQKPHTGRVRAAAQVTKGTQHMTERTFEAELAEVKRELHERIREQAANMTPAERKRIKPEHRKLFEQITRDAEPRESYEPTRYSSSADALDRAFGIGHGMVMTTTPDLRGRRQGGLCPRTFNGKRVTALSSSADALDRAFGIAPAARVR